MGEAVKVIVRCRPMNTREKNLQCTEVVSMTAVQTTLVNPAAVHDPPKSFTFDGCYFSDSTTEQIYNDVCFDLVENILEGYNGTVFAYGQTGCGKSFSMQGIPEPPTQKGIIPRAFDHIFEAVSITKDKQFLVHASYLEIYNEEVRDLLAKDTKKRLEVKEHPDKGIYVQGLSMNEVRNVEECQLLMMRGWNNRSVGATQMNADSSRSHSIFTINLEMITTDKTDNREHILAAKLNLVDLAGSERQGKTGATGDRLKEANKINLSLSALGNVISALVDGKSKHIPYRDSKLTRLLQDSLGGNTKTLMVACLSPAADNYDETLSTLRYANRAKNIKNKPKINEDPKDALLREYKEEIEQLRRLLDGKPLTTATQAIGEKQRHSQSMNIEEEKEKIKQQYEQQIRAMEQQLAQIATAKHALEAELETVKRSREGQGSTTDTGAEEEEEDIRVEEYATPVPSGRDASEEEASKNKLSPRKPESDSYMGEKISPELRSPRLNRSSGSLGQVSDSENLDPVDPTQEGKGATGQERSPPAIEEPPPPYSESATNDGPQSDLSQQQEAAMKRLAELEAMFTSKLVKGGDESSNTTLIEKRAKRKKHAEEKRRAQLRKAAEGDNMDAVVKVYDNVVSEIQDKTKNEERLRRKLEMAESEVRDLQTEFENERRDYLETIRSHTRQLQLAESMLDKVQPLIQRDCNYYNLRRVKDEAVYDYDSCVWRLPDVQRVKTNLPNLGLGQENGVGSKPSKKASPGYDRFEQPQEHRLLDDSRDDDDVVNNYMRPKRAQRILEQGALMSRTKMDKPTQSILDPPYALARTHTTLPQPAYDVTPELNPKLVRLEKLEMERPGSSRGKKKKKDKFMY